MNCPKDNTPMTKEVTLEYFIYKCGKCGYREITDYSDKPVSQKDKILLEDIYFG